MNDEINKKKLKLVTVVWTILFLLTAYLLVLGSVIYFSPSAEKWMRNKFIRKTAQIIPYPAAMVGKNFISTDKLLKNFDAVEKFYEGQDFSDLGMRVDFSTTDGKKRLRIKEKEILGKLIEDAVIKTEAKKRKIVLTDDLINQAVDRKLKEYGAENQLKDNLQKLYGWDMEDFKENIVAPDLYKEKLAQEIRKNEISFSEAKNKISAAQKELADGAKLSDIAKKYSQGESAQEGGVLGWFSYSQMLPEVAEIVFKLEKEKNSEIIESAIGYHIVRVDEKKNENGEEKVKVSQIFIRTESFPEWLLQQEKNYRVFIPFNEFKWDSEKGEVEFMDEKMRSFEKNLLESGASDPSIIF